jgi:hypothetical protein
VDVLKAGRWSLAGLLLSALLSSSCSHDAPPVPTPFGPTPAPATVRIVHKFNPEPPPVIFYTEGALWFVKIETASASGDEIVYEGPEHGASAAEVELAPGDYRLTSFLRPCSGNCGPEFLGGPVDGCESPLQVHSGQELLIAIESTWGVGCTIAFPSHVQTRELHTTPPQP